MSNYAQSKCSGAKKAASNNKMTNDSTYEKQRKLYHPSKLEDLSESPTLWNTPDRNKINPSTVAGVLRLQKRLQRKRNK